MLLVTPHTLSVTPSQSSIDAGSTVTLFFFIRNIFSSYPLKNKEMIGRQKQCRVSVCWVYVDHMRQFNN